jgi:glutathione S-transferase
MTAQLTYFSGSPFARMCRVMVIEWALPVEPVEFAFPPGPEMFALNPLGQVPALIRDGAETVFSTFLVLEALWEMAGRPAEAYDPGRDRQILMAALQATDACAAAAYQKWAGLGPVGRNAVGFDPGARNLERTLAALDWLDDHAATGRLRAGFTLPGVALACLCLWTDARERLDWRSRHRLRPIVETLAARPSFTATAPRKWSPD